MPIDDQLKNLESNKTNKANSIDLRFEYRLPAEKIEEMVAKFQKVKSILQYGQSYEMNVSEIKPILDKFQPYYALYVTTSQALNVTGFEISNWKKNLSDIPVEIQSSKLNENSIVPESVRGCLLKDLETAITKISLASMDIPLDQSYQSWIFNDCRKFEDLYRELGSNNRFIELNWIAGALFRVIHTLNENISVLEYNDQNRKLPASQYLNCIRSLSTFIQKRVIFSSVNGKTPVCLLLATNSTILPLLPITFP